LTPGIIHLESASTIWLNVGEPARERWVAQGTERRKEFPRRGVTESPKSLPFSDLPSASARNWPEMHVGFPAVVPTCE
jgi:hypothetical protein